MIVYEGFYVCQVIYILSHDKITRNLLGFLFGAMGIESRCYAYAISLSLSYISSIL